MKMRKMKNTRKVALSLISMAVLLRTAPEVIPEHPIIENS